MKAKLEMVTRVPDAPRGFWEVVGHGEYVGYNGELVTDRTTSTFAVESSARKFAEAHGGEVRPRAADFILE